MRLQSAIFDMDGTLLDSMPVWCGLAGSVLRELGAEPEANLQEIVQVMTLLQASEYCREHYGLPESAEALEQRMEDRVRDFYRCRVRAKPGVERFLSLLKMEGVWMYVATATDRKLTEAGLRCAGIDGFFRGIVTCSEAGAGKESPEVYERALRRLRSTKKDTVVFEDTLQAIRTAKAAGFRVAGVYDSFNEADQAEIRQIADYYIRSFEEMFEADSPLT